jgi:hypothetical protein
MLPILVAAAVLGAEPRAKIVRDVPHHELEVAADCPADDLLSVAEEIQVAISAGAPTYNRGDHKACYLIYSNTAVALDHRLTKCTGVRKALLAGVDRASHLATFDEKAWAMRDAFDGVLDLIERAAAKPQAQTKRNVPRLPLKVLEDCSRDDRKRIALAIGDAIDAGAPAFNDGKIEVCYRLYQGTALDLQDAVPQCTGLKRALMKGVEAARGEKTAVGKAWAMRDAFDGVIEVIDRGFAPRTNEL